jgi:hypothetical protein
VREGDPSPPGSAFRLEVDNIRRKFYPPALASNAEARLKYLYFGDASLRFEISEDHVATVFLTLPALNSPQVGVEGSPVQTVLKRENPICASSSSTTNH